jgi:hypothetical protein
LQHYRAMTGFGFSMSSRRRARYEVMNLAGWIDLLR